MSIKHTHCSCLHLHHVHVCKRVQTCLHLYMHKHAHTRCAHSWPSPTTSTQSSPTHTHNACHHVKINSPTYSTHAAVVMGNFMVRKLLDMLVWSVTLDIAQPCHLLKPNWKLPSSHNVPAPANISTQFLLQSVCVRACVCVHTFTRLCMQIHVILVWIHRVCACVCFHILLYGNCFGETVLDMCIENRRLTCIMWALRTIIMCVSGCLCVCSPYTSRWASPWWLRWTTCWPQGPVAMRTRRCCATCLMDVGPLSAGRSASSWPTSGTSETWVLETALL